MTVHHDETWQVAPTILWPGPIIKIGLLIGGIGGGKGTRYWLPPAFTIAIVSSHSLHTLPTQLIESSQSPPTILTQILWG